MIVAVPSFSAFTVPFASTAAISAALLVHFTSRLSSVLLGINDTSSFSVLPFRRSVISVLFSAILSVWIGTFTSHTAVILLFAFAVAITFVFPPATAVTTPFSSTVATLSFSLFHVTAFSSVVSAGELRSFAPVFGPCRADGQPLGLRERHGRGGASGLFDHAGTRFHLGGPALCQPGRNGE